MKNDRRKLYVGNAIRPTYDVRRTNSQIYSLDYPIVASSSKEAEVKLIEYLNTYHHCIHYNWKMPDVKELKVRKRSRKISLETRVEIIEEVLGQKAIR